MKATTKHNLDVIGNWALIILFVGLLSSTAAGVLHRCSTGASEERAATTLQPQPKRFTMVIDGKVRGYAEEENHGKGQ